MVNVAVSVGATMVTGTLTAVPFGGTVMIELLTETERLIGGGAKLPHRTTPDQGEEECSSKRDLLNLAILQHLFGHFSRCTRPLL